MPVRTAHPATAPAARVNRAEFVYSVRMTAHELEQLSRLAENVDLAAACQLSDALAAARRALRALGCEPAATPYAGTLSFRA